MPPSLFSFPNNDELAAQLRKYVLESQNSAFERHGYFRVAVSGGSLPKTLAKALLAPGDGSPEDTAQFAKWQVFFADERAVPLDHEDSNYKLVKDEWLDKIPEDLGQPTVYPIDVQYLDDVQELADQYEQVLVKSFAAKDSVRLPLFDLILLGCGPDGHTCSLFPGHPLLRETDAWVYSIEDSPKPPPKRITLSLPVVCHGLKIGFVATGGGKKDILRQIFDTEEGHQLPCGLVNQGAGDKVAWFCDDDAVEGVAFPKRATTLSTKQHSEDIMKRTSSLRKPGEFPKRTEHKVQSIREEPSDNTRSASVNLSDGFTRLPLPSPVKSSANRAAADPLEPRSALPTRTPSNASSQASTPSLQSRPRATEIAHGRKPSHSSIKPKTSAPQAPSNNLLSRTQSLRQPTDIREGALKTKNRSPEPIAEVKPTTIPSSRERDGIPKRRPVSVILDPSSTALKEALQPPVRKHTRSSSAVTEGRGLKLPEKSSLGQRPAFSTLQQHFTPKKPASAPPAAKDVRGSGADEAVSQDLLKLQGELLQLQLLHEQSAITLREWEDSARQKCKATYEEVTSLQDEVDDEQAQLQARLNLLDLQEWYKSTAGGFGFAESVQLLSSVLQELPLFTSTEGKYAGLVRQFEEWYASVEVIWDVRRSGSCMEQVEDIEEKWKTDCIALVRKSTALLRDLSNIMPVRDQTSTLAQTLQHCKAFFAGVLEELQTLQHMRASIISKEAVWAEKTVDTICASADRDGTLLFSSRDSSPSWSGD